MSLTLSEPAYWIELEANAPWFTDPLIGELLIAQIDTHRRHGDFRLHAFVLLPRAWHAIVTPDAGCIQTVVQMIRRATSKRLNPHLEHELRWKGRIKAPIQNAWELLLLCGEIHLLPVRAGLVEDPEHYPFSSLVTLDVDEPPLGLTAEEAVG